VLHLNTCARSSPQHKMRIVDSLKRRSQNRSHDRRWRQRRPALKRANIGIAMGITGTDVTKQTADMVLTDDNYASIVSAIEEGRIIYSNIRKFVFYLISCNIGEILIIFFSMLAGMPAPTAADSASVPEPGLRRRSGAGAGHGKGRTTSCSDRRGLSRSRSSTGDADRRRGAGRGDDGRRPGGVPHRRRSPTCAHRRSHAVQVANGGISRPSPCPNCCGRSRPVRAPLAVQDRSVQQ